MYEGNPDRTRSDFFMGYSMIPMHIRLPVESDPPSYADDDWLMFLPRLLYFVAAYRNKTLLGLVELAHTLDNSSLFFFSKVNSGREKQTYHLHRFAIIAKVAVVVEHLDNILTVRDHSWVLDDHVSSLAIG